MTVICKLQINTISHAEFYVSYKIYSLAIAYICVTDARPTSQNGWTSVCGDMMAFLGRSGFCDMRDMHDQVSTCAVPKVFATFFLTTCTIDLYTTSY